MHENIVNMSIICSELHVVLAGVIFCTLPFLDSTCEIAYENLYKSEYIVDILPVLINYFLPKAFVCDINFFFYYYLLKCVKYKVLSEYSTLIGQFPSKSVKVSKKKNRMEF